MNHGADSALSGLERAALLLFAVGPERAAELLKCLEPGDLERMGLAMASIRNASLGQVDEALSQFIAAADLQAALGGDPQDYVRTVFSNVVGSQQANDLTERVPVGEAYAGLCRFKRMDAWTIAEFVRDEHPQIVANLLCLLDGERAAAVIRELPKEVRADLMARVASLESISREVLQELDELITDAWGADREIRVSPVRGVNRAARILHHLDADIGARLLDELSGLDSELAQKVHDRLFVFEELIHLNGKSMQILLREITRDQLLLALQGASEELKEKVFANMSKRTAQLVRDDLAAEEPARKSDIDAVQKEVLLIVKTLANAGIVEFEYGEGQAG